MRSQKWKWKTNTRNEKPAHGETEACRMAEEGEVKVEY